MDADDADSKAAARMMRFTAGEMTMVFTQY